MPEPESKHGGEWADVSKSVGDVVVKLVRVMKVIWGRASKRLKMVTGITAVILIALLLWQPSASSLPSISLEYSGPPKSPFNESRVALLIENRPNPILAPLMLHFMTVVPPEWRFRFMGSNVSVAHINSSAAIRDMVRIGKLDLTYIPSNMTTNSQEEISQFLTNRWIYETVLAPAQHLLVFQTDSMLCANSRQSINDWLDYDWVGAPWSPTGKWGGNGGLSLRKVSAIVDILKNQVRSDKTPEDVWLAERLAHRPGAKMANGTASLTFSGEMHGGEVVKISPQPSPEEGKAKHSAGGGIDSDKTEEENAAVDLWRDGFYEPMGYHTGDNGRTMHSAIWGTPEMRSHIWRYCPEVKMIFEMDAADYVLGKCNTNWKRDGISAGQVKAGLQGEDCELSTGEMQKRDIGKRQADEYDENGIPYAIDRLVGW